MAQATEAQFEAHLASDDEGDCPGCGALWQETRSRGTVRTHRDGCRYLAWLTKKAGKPKAAVK
jgi:hypothetical protein